MQQLSSDLYFELWPEAEDRAMRGRNPSAVFRTLYRQAGRLLKELPSCAWRVETQCDKSTPLIFQSAKISQRIAPKSVFSKTQTLKPNSPSDCPFFRGKPMDSFRVEPQGSRGSGLRGFARPCGSFGRPRDVGGSARSKIKIKIRIKEPGGIPPLPRGVHPETRKDP